MSHYQRSANGSLPEVHFNSIILTKPLTSLVELDPVGICNEWTTSSEDPTTFKPIIEGLVDRFLDPAFIQGITDLQLIEFTSLRVHLQDGVWYDPRYESRNFNILRMKRACVEIAAVMGYSVGTPELQKYCDLVRILSALPSNECSLIKQVLELRVGPITALAARITAENINFFMDKAKLSNTIPLIHNVFSSPTLLGKLNAIWKLLELHGMLWNGIAWSTISAIVHALYSSFFFLVEKCKMAGAFLKQGFKWVAPKRMQDKEDVECQAAEKLVEGAELLLEQNHGNDCLYEAVAPQIANVPQTLKRDFCSWLLQLTSLQIDEVLVANGTSLAEEKHDSSTILQLASGPQMKSDVIAVLLSEYLHRNIVVIGEDHTIENKNYVCDEEALFIRNAVEHFTMCDPSVVEATNLIGQNPRLVTPLLCSRCAKSGKQFCPLCKQRCCAPCASKCCSEPKSKIVKKEQHGVIEFARTPSQSDDEEPDAFFVDPAEPPKEPEVKEEPPKEESPAQSIWGSVEEGWEAIKTFFRNLDINGVCNQIFAFLQNLFTDVYEWIKHNPVVVGLASFAGTMATLLGISLPTINNPLDKRSLINRISDASKNVYYAQRASAGVMDAFKDLGEAFASSLGISTDSRVQDFKQRVVELNITATQFLHIAQTEPSKIVNSTQEMAAFGAKMKEIEQAYRDLMRLSDKANVAAINPVWQSLSKAYTNLSQLWIKYNNAISERQEPVVIWLWGETNQGKSKIIGHIVDEINSRTKREMKVFTISKGPSYWNGYCGQDIIKIDDFGCWNGQEGNLDALHMFNLKTCAAYNPNMAGMGEKEILATPKFVIVASNEPTIPLNTAIQDIAAFERRRDFLVRVTWPGHEKCAKQGDCEHIRELKTKLIQDKKLVWDHLEFFINASDVSSFFCRNNKTYRKIPAKETLKGHPVTLENLIEAFLAKEEESRAVFEITANSRLKPIVTPQAQDRYQEYPNIFLAGPPGTGKSFILDNLQNDPTILTHRIGCQEEFDAFCEDGYRAPQNTQFVLFDDLSNYATSKHFGSFLKKVKERADVVSTIQCWWVMGLNKLIFEGAIRSIFVRPTGDQAADDIAAIEAQDMIYRRALTINSMWKKRRDTWTSMLRTQWYNRDDVVRQDNPVPIDEAVEYACANTGERFGQSSVVYWIKAKKTRIQRISEMTQLPTATMKKPDCSVTFDMDSKEFLDIITHQSLSKILGLISSSRVKVNSGIVNKGDLIQRVRKSVADARSHAGCTFDSLDEFFLVASNRRFLANFDGLTCYLMLRDASYSMERGTFPYTVAHRVDASQRDAQNIISELQKVQETVSAADFVTFSALKFSPWFCFVGDLIASISKTALTAVSISHSIAEQEKAAAAISVYNSVSAMATAYATKEISAVSNTFERTVHLSNDKREKTATALPNKDDDIHADKRVLLMKSIGKLEQHSKNRKVASEMRQILEDVTPQRIKRGNATKVSKVRKEHEDVAEESDGESIPEDDTPPRQKRINATKNHDRTYGRVDKEDISPPKTQRGRAVKTSKSRPEGGEPLEETSRPLELPAEREPATIREAFERTAVELQYQMLTNNKAICGSETEYVEDVTRGKVKGRPVRTKAVVILDEVKQIRPEYPILELCADPTIIPIAESLVKNMLTITNAAGDRVCYALAIKENLATTVWHILPHYPNLSGLFCKDYQGNVYRMDVESEHIVTDRLDVRLVPTKGAIQFPDIIHHLAPVNYKNYIGKDCMLVHLSYSILKNQPVLVMRSYRAVRNVSQECPTAGTKVHLIEFIGHQMGYIATDVNTRKGDCGSLLIVSDPGHNEGKVIGLHSRATTKNAFVRPIQREDYLSIPSQCLEALVVGKVQGEVVGASHPNEPQLRGKAVYTTFLPTKTRLHRNLVPLGEKVSEPSILSNDDIRNPGLNMLQKEAAKWCETPKEISLELKNILRESVYEVATDFAATLSRNGATLSVMTKREALNKDRHAVQSEPIPMKSSAGYPWNRLTTEAGKHAYLLTDPDTGLRRFQKSVLVQKLHRSIDDLKWAALDSERDYAPPIFQIFLKDEPLKLKKIYGEEPKTRTIAAAPLHLQIIHRQYVLGGIAAIMDNHIDLPVAVGMDPLSADWDIMFRRATAIGREAVALDYKGWDFTLNQFIVEEILPTFWNTLYQNLDPDWKIEDDYVRNFIYKNIAHAHILVGNKVYEITRGLVSGVISTAIDNSVANLVKKVTDWKAIMKKKWPEISTYDYFKTLLYTKFYGDDFFIVLSDIVKEFYNAITIRDFEEANYGVTLTSADKESPIVKYQSIYDITFMARKFVIINERCVGRLEYDRILKPSWWVHDDRSHNIWESPDRVARNLDACFSAYESILIEMVFYGPLKFDDVRNKAQRAFDEVGYGKILPDYGSILAEVTGVPPLPGNTAGAYFYDYTQNEEVKKLLFKPTVPKSATKFKNRTSWHYGPSYKYVGGEHPPAAVPTSYNNCLQYFNQKFNRRWNSVLVNVYDKGGGIPFHKDNEPEVDPEEGVGCLTLTGDGILTLFNYRRPLVEQQLFTGTFYIMEEDCLKEYQHKRDRHTTETISLTFRRLRRLDSSLE